jgi:adenosylcobyric acid synthase
MGVIPYLQSMMLDEEDSLGLPETGQTRWTDEEMGDTTCFRRLRIAVIAFPSFSNFTDFDSLRAESSVSLRFCRTVETLVQADLVILPGSKQTVDDLFWMRSLGLDQAVKQYAKKGLVVGICGGMQMLGQSIADPLSMEHKDVVVDGLRLLPIQTIMQPDKLTRNVKGELVSAMLFGQPVGACRVAGYEIHIGRTVYQSGASHLVLLLDSASRRDGCISADTHIFGTYLHGIFDGDEFRHHFLSAARAFYGLTPVGDLYPWKQLREESLNRLAHTVETSLDMKEIFRWVGLSYQHGAAQELQQTEDITQ